MNDEERAIIEHIELIVETSPENLPQFRRWAEQNLQECESAYETYKFRMQNGMSIDGEYWSMTGRKATFAKLYLNKINSEIERIKLTMPKQEINHVEGDNYGNVGGKGNNVKNDFSVNKNQSSSKAPKRKSRKKIIAGIVIAIIIGLSIAYMTHLFGWNK